MAANQKRQFRVHVGAHNSKPPRALEFHDLDLAFGRPEAHQPRQATGLHCRIRNEDPPRTLVLAPAIAVGDVFFSGIPGTLAEDATDSLLVTEVYAQRLLAITEREARLEGVAASWGLKLSTRRRAASEEEVHETLLEAVGDDKLRRWRAHEENADETTARNLFALNYLRQGRTAFHWWRLNPWVWAVGFEWHAARPANLLERLASGTLERKRA